MPNDPPELRRIELEVLAAAESAGAAGTPIAHAFEAIGLEDQPAADMVSRLVEVGVLRAKFTIAGFYDVAVTDLGHRALDRDPGRTTPYRAPR